MVKKIDRTSYRGVLIFMEFFPGMVTTPWVYHVAVVIPQLAYITATSLGSSSFSGAGVSGGNESTVILAVAPWTVMLSQWLRIDNNDGRFLRNYGSAKGA